MQYKKIKNNFFENCIEKFYLFDWKFFILIILLIGVGLLTLYSVDTGNKNYLLKHFIRINFALILFFVISFIHIRFWYKLAYPFYFTIILLLLYVNFFKTIIKKIIFYFFILH